MALTGHSLGQHCFVHNKTGTVLATNVSLSLSSFDGLRFPFSNIFQDLRRLVMFRTWISNSTRFQISFRLFINDFGLEVPTFIEDFGAILCDAEVSVS